jgi:predicted transcriptional regulator of viral defense system
MTYVGSSIGGRNGSNGLVTRADALTAGLTDRQIGIRVESGQWERVHAGVFRLVPATPSPEQQLLAAVLACGVTVFASHQSAASLWQLTDRPPGHPAVTVSRNSHPSPMASTSTGPRRYRVTCISVGASGAPVPSRRLSTLPPWLSPGS